MMSSGAAASAGAKTALLEKGDRLGRKLSITGKGRCNLAHMEQDKIKLSEAFGKNGKFLLSSLSRFGLPETLDFFGKRGINVTVERGGRVFPGPGQNSQDVINSLWDFMSQGQVHIFTDSEVREIKAPGGRVTAVKGNFGTIGCKAAVVATGGLSYPDTGSTGDGYRFALSLGHAVTRTSPALCPVKTSDSWCKDLLDLTLKNVGLSLWQGGKEISSRFGEMTFAPFGISGAIVMDMAKEIGSALERGPAALFLDLKPALDRGKLDSRVLRDLKSRGSLDMKSCLRALLPGALIRAVLKIAGIQENAAASSLTKEQRASLVETLKALPLTPTGLLGYRWALVTSGGVSLKGIDPKTMESKKTKGLFFAGEVLDLDGPTGGYNLQACWSTGFSAGKSACIMSLEGSETSA